MSLKPLLNTVPDKGLLTKLAESVGLTAKDISGITDIPTVGDITRSATSGIKTLHDDAMIIYKDGEENFSEIGRELADTKNQLFGTFHFAVALLFIFLGGSVLLYGPEVFSVFVALYERVKANGVSFSFAL